MPGSGERTLDSHRHSASGLSETEIVEALGREFFLALERLEGVRVTSVSVAIDGVHASDLGMRNTPTTDAAASA